MRVLANIALLVSLSGPGRLVSAKFAAGDDDDDDLSRSKRPAKKPEETGPMIDDWDLGRFTVRGTVRQSVGRARARRKRRATVDGSSSNSRPCFSATRTPPPPSNPQQSFVGLAIMLLLVVYHYAVAEDAPAQRNQ